MFAILPPLRESKEPLAWRAAASLRGAVLSGRWRVGDRLPSEPELARDLGISRPTLREAVRLLISDGILDRQHGVGTFVRRVPILSIDRGLDELFSLTDAIQQMGYSAATRSCEVERMQPRPEIAAELRLASGDLTWHVRRVRLADDRPVIIGEDWFAVGATPGYPAARIRRELMTSGSIYSWLEHSLGIRLESASARIEPVVADAAIAEALDKPIGSPLLRLVQTHYADSGSPVLYSDSIHDSGVIHFQLTRRRATPPY